MRAPRILVELKRFLSSSTWLHPEVEELLVKWYVGKIVEQNLTIVSGFPGCVLSILDEAMVPYDSVFELVAPYSVIVVKPELAEKIVEVMGKAEGMPWFISTCYLNEKCIYHVHKARELDPTFIAKHIVILRHVSDLLLEYALVGLCDGETPAEVFMNCLKRLSNDLVIIARRKEDELLTRVLNDPFKVYCTPDIVVKHSLSGK